MRKLVLLFALVCAVIPAAHAAGNEQVKGLLDRVRKEATGCMIVGAFAEPVQAASAMSGPFQGTIKWQTNSREHIESICRLLQRERVEGPRAEEEGKSSALNNFALTFTFKRSPQLQIRIVGDSFYVDEARYERVEEGDYYLEAELYVWLRKTGAPFERDASSK